MQTNSDPLWWLAMVVAAALAIVPFLDRATPSLVAGRVRLGD